MIYNYDLFFMKIIKFFKKILFWIVEGKVLESFIIFKIIYLYKFEEMFFKIDKYVW